MSGMISKAKFGAHMAKLTQIPEGFTGKLESKTLGWGDTRILTYVVRSADGSIEIEFDQTGNGHTNFDVKQSEHGTKLHRTFDRLGVEDSFYHLPMWKGDKTRYDLNKILKQQLKRIEDYYEYLKTALQVPGIPHTVSPERLKELKQRLTKSGSITFMPSGFGTGYVVTVKRARDSKPAPQGMAEFFGVKQLFISTIDCD